MKRHNLTLVGMKKTRTKNLLSTNEILNKNKFVDTKPLYISSLWKSQAFVRSTYKQWSSMRWAEWTLLGRKIPPLNLLKYLWILITHKRHNFSPLSCFHSSCSVKMNQKNEMTTSMLHSKKEVRLPVPVQRFSRMRSEPLFTFTHVF